MDKEFTSAARVVDTTTEQLWAMMNHPATGWQWVEFTKEVKWLEETEAQVVFMHGGEEVETYGTYVDFYGYGTSTAEATKKAMGVAEKFGVNSQSSAEVVVVERVFRYPALPGESQEALELNRKHASDPIWKQRWKEFPTREWRKKVEGSDGETRYVDVGREVRSEKIAWSSKTAEMKRQQCAGQGEDKG